ncbi:MAG: hypothetical protein AAF211_16220 [Myxococcota bacterium]
MDSLIVMYGLREGVDPTRFEQWLRDVDLPGYAALRTLQNPAYYRVEGTLDGPESDTRYIIVLKATGNRDAINDEMAAASWKEFVESFEARVDNPRYLTATLLFGPGSTNQA